MSDYDNPPPGHVHDGRCSHSPEYWHREKMRTLDELAEGARERARIWGQAWWVCMIGLAVIGALVLLGMAASLTAPGGP